MGMFDVVKVNTDRLPVSDKEKLLIDESNVEWQTKDLDCILTEIYITDEKELKINRWDLEEVPKEKRPFPNGKGLQEIMGSFKRVNQHLETLNHTGWICFYGYIGNDFYQFNAKFVDGKLITIGGGKRKEMAKKKKSFDRHMNPNDGSRRRQTQEHKSEKVYDRNKEKEQLLKEIMEADEKDGLYDDELDITSIENAKIDKSISKRLKMTEKLLLKKREEYASGDKHRFHNFMSAARVNSIHPARALHGMMMKHFVSYLDMLSEIEQNKEIDRRKIKEKFGDLITYFILQEQIFLFDHDLKS